MHLQYFETAKAGVEVSSVKKMVEVVLIERSCSGLESPREIRPSTHTMPHAVTIGAASAHLEVAAGERPLLLDFHVASAALLARHLLCLAAYPVRAGVTPALLFSASDANPDLTVLLIFPG